MRIVAAKDEHPHIQLHLVQADIDYQHIPRTLRNMRPDAGANPLPNRRGRTTVIGRARLCLRTWRATLLTYGLLSVSVYTSIMLLRETASKFSKLAHKSSSAPKSGLTTINTQRSVETKLDGDISTEKLI